MLETLRCFRVTERELDLGLRLTASTFWKIFVNFCSQKIFQFTSSMKNSGTSVGGSNNEIEDRKLLIFLPDNFLSRNLSIMRTESGPCSLELAQVLVMAVVSSLITLNV